MRIITEEHLDELSESQNKLFRLAMRQKKLIERLKGSRRRNKHALIAEAARRFAIFTLAYADGLGSVLQAVDDANAVVVDMMSVPPYAPESALVH